MSGGSLNYFFGNLEDHARDFDDRELNELVSDLATIFHDYEWFTSGDTDEGDWRESKQKFKKKWFTAAGRKERVERYIQKNAEELREMFGLNDHKRCEYCKHWTPPKDKDSEYGSCEFAEHYSMHRFEVCKKWEKNAND